MDIQKEREAFEHHLTDIGLVEFAGYGFEVDECDEYLHEPTQVAWDSWLIGLGRSKAQAVPEEKGRSDFEIITQTIELVDLIAGSNRFQRDKSKPFPFESNNPRNIEWWRLACKIQELLTDTDPENCDFDEYKAMIEAQEPAND
ncbi:hypothetical protein [Acinetobacter sp. YH12140]|uniref:hypothetical protein n=1 Tax=Acinetobacter sp. YH12140 TaxID=2601124 RepID=UPI0015D440BA|nr:hypothetical protein [Acinetobacter sp. YH12140]